MFRKCCQSVLLVLAASWVLLGWGVTASRHPFWRVAEGVNDAER